MCFVQIRAEWGWNRTANSRSGGGNGQRKEFGFLGRYGECVTQHHAVLQYTFLQILHNIVQNIWPKNRERVCISWKKGQIWAQHSRKPNSPLVVFEAFSTNKTFLYLLFLEAFVSGIWETPWSVTNPLYTWNPDPSLEYSTLSISLFCFCVVKIIIGFPQYIFSACELKCSLLGTLPVCPKQNILRSNLVDTLGMNFQNMLLHGLQT